MKEIIQRIISDLSDLTPPFNPVKIKHIFEQHPVLEIEQTPSQLLMHVQQLITLRDLIETSFIIAAKKHHLSLRLDELIKLKKHDETLQQKAGEYQMQLQSTIDLLNSSFLVLEPLIRENLTEHDLLLIPHTASTDNKSQQLAVLEFQAYITKLVAAINRNRAKISLLQLKNKLGELVIELNTLGIPCTTMSVMDECKSLTITSKQTVNLLEEINKKCSELISQIHIQISVKEIKAQLKYIAAQEEAVSKSLAKIQFDMSINTLALDIKGNLLTQFGQATNKADLIKCYQDQIPSAFYSFFNLTAWSCWVEDHKKYEVSIREKENSFNYLTLLNEKELMLSHRESLVEQRQVLENLLPQAQSNISDTMVCTNLLIQAQELLHQYPLAFPNILATNNSLTDCYLTFSRNLPLNEKKLQQMSLINKTADVLSSTINDLNELRRVYQLPVDQDALLVRQCELEAQIELFPSEDLLGRWHIYCKSFLESDATLELLLQQQQAVKIQRSAIAVQIDKANLELPDVSQIESLDKEFSSLQQEIAKSIEQISTLILTPNDLDTPLVIFVPPIAITEQSLPTDKQDPVDLALSLSNEKSNQIVPISPPPMALQRDFPIEHPKNDESLVSPIALSLPLYETNQLLELLLEPETPLDLLANTVRFAPLSEDKSRPLDDQKELVLPIESPILMPVSSPYSSKLVELLSISAELPAPAETVSVAEC